MKYFLLGTICGLLLIPILSGLLHLFDNNRSLALQSRSIARIHLQVNEELIHILNNPFETSIKGANEHARGSRKTYSEGNYGITDIGNCRLIVEDLPFSGTSSSGGIALFPPAFGSGSDRTGTGNRTFISTSKDGSVVCQFGGVEFLIRDGHLYIDDYSVDLMDEKLRFIVIDKQKKVQLLFSAVPIGLPVDEEG